MAERGSDNTSTQVRGADLGEDPVDLCFTSLSKKVKRPGQMTMRHFILKMADALGLVAFYERLKDPVPLVCRSTLRLP